MACGVAPGGMGRLRYPFDRKQSSLTAMAANERSWTRSAFQFTLRDVFLVFVAVSATLAASCWNLMVGVATALALSGALTVFAGVRKRRRGAVLAGLVLIVLAAGCVALLSTTVLTWVGSHELRVHVLVVDASKLTPISNARVRLLSGPRSPLEGPPPVIDRAFKVIPLGNGAALTTDDRGYAQFAHRFFAAGSDGLFTKEGYVDTAQVWLRVSRPGYATTYLAIDQQSGKPRDIRNDTPIWVTVPVAKVGRGGEQSDEPDPE